MEMKKQENAKDMYLCDRKRKGAEKCYPQQWQRLLLQHPLTAATVLYT
jgi:hypothetical protein